MVPLLRGRYRPIQPIGQGGFGRTYVALDQDRLSTRCVIKQFSPQTQGTKSLEKAIRLFGQEATRLHELGEHPQIPTLLAYFEQDEYLYLVQQFIEGQTLVQELQRQGAFSEQKIRAVLNDLLLVLQFVHAHQVIHRDITPANIIRRKIDNRLVLIDFGVAKQLTDTGLVQPGTRVGTEGYSPIEQLRSGRVYPSSDLYSLGATCIYLLTRTKLDHLYDPLRGRWLWREYLAKQGVGVSDRLSKILNKMLKDLVSDRYQSADEILRDLNAESSSSAASSAQRHNITTTLPTSQPPTSKQPTSKPSTSQLPTSNPARATPRLSTPPVPGRTRQWQCIQTLSGHSSWVMSVAVSSNTPTLVSGGLDDTIKVWNLYTGELLNTLIGHSKGVNSVALSSDGKILVSGSDDDTIKVWNLYIGEQLYTLRHGRDVNSVMIGSDNSTLASGSEDRLVKLWQLGTGAPIRSLLGSTGMIKSIAISPDCQTLASGGLDNKVTLWSLHTGELIQSLTGHVNSINQVTIAPDNKTLISASKDKTIKLWSLPTGKLLKTLSGHSREVNTVTVSADGKTLVSGSSDATIKLWNLSTGELQHTLAGHSNAVNSVVMKTDGQTLISGSSDQTVKIWQLASVGL